MEDPKWLRLITIGLVLAALAVGYFLFSGRSSRETVTGTPSPVSQVAPPATSSASPTLRSQIASPTPTSAYNRIVSRTQNGPGAAQTLPRTGFPAGLAIILAVSVMISGWGLRRFPH